MNTRAGQEIVLSAAGDSWEGRTSAFEKAEKKWTCDTKQHTSIILHVFSVHAVAITDVQRAVIFLLAMLRIRSPEPEQVTYSLSAAALPFWVIKYGESVSDAFVIFVMRY